MTKGCGGRSGVCVCMHTAVGGIHTYTHGTAKETELKLPKVPLLVAPNYYGYEFFSFGLRVGVFGCLQKVNI
jgi:hypothetical protein